MHTTKCVKCINIKYLAYRPPLKFDVEYFQYPEKVASSSISVYNHSSPFPKGNHCFSFYHHQLVWGKQYFVTFDNNILCSMILQHMIPVLMPFLSKTRDSRVIESAGYSLQGGRMHMSGEWGHLRKRVQKRRTGFGVLLDDSGEGLRKEGFGLDWMLSGNGGDSVTGDLRDSN